MGLVIAAGCPGSGWEAVVPVLRRAGLDSADERVAGWLDELFAARGDAGTGGPGRFLQPDDGMAERAAALLPDGADTSFMLADGRNLWLLDFWAARFPQARFLLFYKRADLALVHALPQGVDTRRFLEDWEAGSRLLLQFQRRHRRRAVLLDAEAAAQRPGALIGAARRSGLALNDLSDWPEAAPDAPVPVRFLASCLVSGGATALNAELEASALPLDGQSQPVPPSAGEFLDSYRRWQERERELQQQLDDARGQLQRSSEAQKAQSGEIAGLREELGRAQAEGGTLQAALAAADHETARLSGELIQAHSDLEAGQARLLQGDLLRQELDARQEELRTQLEQAQRALLAAEASQREAGQDNELLLTQLGQLHEDLDRAYAEGEGRVAALAAAALENASLAGELAQARSELGASQDRLQEGELLRRELDAQQDELRAQLEQAHQALQTAEASRRGVERDNELLLAQLGQTHEDLARTQAAGEARETALAAANLENERLAGALERARSEQEVIEGRLREAEHYCHELSARLDESKARLDQTQQALQGAEGLRQDLVQENELLVTQLGQLQEEVEHYSVKSRELLSQIQAKDREIDALGRRVADIQGSILWKAASRLRALTGAFKSSPNPNKAELKRLVELIDDSGLFDRKWYLTQYGDVRRAGIDPVRHYLIFGAPEGRNPSPDFDTRFYLSTYHDVGEAGINPLVHFIKFGRAEGRKPSPLGRPL